MTLHKKNNIPTRTQARVEKKVHGRDPTIKMVLVYYWYQIVLVLQQAPPQIVLVLQQAPPQVVAQDKQPR
jgi:hypothetical protein